MNDLSVGRVCRLTRLRAGLRQRDVADKAGVSQQLVSLIERGFLDRVSVRTLRRVLAVLGITVELVVRSRGADIARLLAAGHSQLHEEVATLFADLPAWVHAPEVTFAIHGERGAIDILAWHAARRMLLIIELKTELVDVQDLIGVLDRKERLAGDVARRRGWHPAAVSVWVVMAEGATNRRRVQAHANVLRSAFPVDGRSMRGWLRDPDRPIRALSFWASPPRSDGRRPASQLRVRTRRAA